MTPAEHWLASLWPFVRAQLPPSPASVLEIGCGSLGGFVPTLLECGYEAVGIDRNAPEAAGYHRSDFEHYEPPAPVDAVVASRSLHHVSDLDQIAGRVVGALRPGGALIVVEWARERVDEDTARWCFARLDAAPESEPGWLHRRRDDWLASGQTWEAYFEAWAAREHLHRGEQILALLDTRFERRLCTHGPYFFADVPGIAEADEEAAIAAREIRATGIRYAGTPRR